MFAIKDEPAIVAETREKILMEFKDLEFHEEGHIYILNGCQLPSVTQLAHRFICEPFDEAFQAMRYAERHGETPEYWIRQWRQNSFRATTLGTKTHEFGESLAYLRAGHPEMIRPSVISQYSEEYSLGIYGLWVMYTITEDVNTIATPYDRKTTMNFLLLAFVFSWLTLGIAPLVWYHRISNRIGNELLRRGIPYKFGAGTFWGWGILGVIIIIGPLVYCHKMMKSMNLLCADYNVRG